MEECSMIWDLEIKGTSVRHYPSLFLANKGAPESLVGYTFFKLRLSESHPTIIIPIDDRVVFAQGSRRACSSRCRGPMD